LLFTDSAGMWAAAGCEPICLGCTTLRAAWWKHVKCSAGQLPTITELATAWQVQRALQIYVPTIEVEVPNGWSGRSNTGRRLRTRG
jgi:hypothetical protein